jgi:N-acetylglucosaminyldiphosphoundecaprenol N-acetyl-beta-D-mannosaminyltransferase
LLGVTLPGRVTGADLVPALASLAAQRGYSLYLLGGRAGVAARAGQLLQEQNPGLRIAGAVSPPHLSVLDANPALVDDIHRAQPDALLVALGNPKQEKWIAMHAPELAVPVMIGVGGSLDFIAGVTRRAPPSMQRLGLEWAYRLAREPRRLWRRYVVDLAGLAYFFGRQWWNLRRGGIGSLPVLPASGTVLVGGVAVIRVQGHLTLATRDSFLYEGEEALRATSHLVVDLAQASFLDSAGYGALIALAQRAASAGGELRLTALQRPVAQMLRVLRLDQFFETCPDVAAALQQVPHLVRGSTESDTSVPAPHGWQKIIAPRRLDASTAPEFRDRCLAVLALSPRLIVDLSGTVFLASAGLAVLIALTREARERNGELRLASPTPDAMRVVKIAKLESVLAFYPNVGTAGG